MTVHSMSHDTGVQCQFYYNHLISNRCERNNCFIKFLTSINAAEFLAIIQENIFALWHKGLNSTALDVALNFAAMPKASSLWDSVPLIRDFVYKADKNTGTSSSPPQPLMWHSISLQHQKHNFCGIVFL